MTRVAVDPLYGCWLWMGQRTPSGYGRLADRRYVHVAVVAALHPDLAAQLAAGELQVDHRCCRRACCRPVHLAAVTPSVNTSLRAFASRLRHRYCDAHTDSVQRAVTPEKGIVCRVCSREGRDEVELLEQLLGTREAMLR